MRATGFWPQYAATAQVGGGDERSRKRTSSRNISTRLSRVIARRSGELPEPSPPRLPPMVSRVRSISLWSIVSL